MRQKPQQGMDDADVGAGVAAAHSILRAGGRGANQIPAPGNPAGLQAGPTAVPTITIAIAANGCSASWNGLPVTPAQITERSVAFLERAIAAVGGARKVTEATFPVFNVEAPAELGFACADTILFALQRAGAVSVRLRSAGRAPVPVDFPFDMNVPPPIPTVLGIGAGGQMTWNNDPIDATALAAEPVRIGCSPSGPSEGVEPPPGGLELRVTREATFGQVYDLLRTTRRYHLRPFLYLPSGEASPAPAPAPPPDALPPPR